MLEQYRKLLEALSLAEVEEAATKAENLRNNTQPTAPFYAELADLARVAREVADSKRKAQPTQ